VLLVVLSAVLLVGLGVRPFFDPDESRYAEIPREMLASGDWTVPHLWGVPYLEKPPLGYWLVAVAFATFGRSEAIGRFVPALFTLATLVLVVMHGRRVLGKRGGLLAGVVFATALFPQAIGRTLVLDPILCFFTTAVLFFGHRICTGDGDARRLRLALAAFAALGTLVKGPIAFVLPGVALAASQLARRDLRALLRLVSPASIALFLAIAAPWFVAVTLREPDFPRFFVVEQHLERYASPKGYHGESAWVLVAVAVGGLGPWMFALPRAAAEIWKGERRDVARTAAIWAVVLVAFFLPSQSRLVTYVLPAFPAFAILLAAAMPKFDVRGPAAATAIAFTAGAVALPLLHLDEKWADGARALEPWVVAAALCASFAAVAASRMPRASLAALAAITPCLFVGVELGALRTSPWLCSKNLSDRLVALRSPEEPLVQFGSPHRHSLVYYSQSYPVQVGTAGENEYGFRLAGVVGTRWFEDRDQLRRAIGVAPSAWLVVDERNETYVRSQLEEWDVADVVHCGEARLLHLSARRDPSADAQR
jgi:4-amino-4-deoxy-L-arabinose transferase-like glycosyltransferase